MDFLPKEPKKHITCQIAQCLSTLLPPPLLSFSPSKERMTLSAGVNAPPLVKNLLSADEVLVFFPRANLFCVFPPHARVPLLSAKLLVVFMRYTSFSDRRSVIFT